ncbi:hypothetical protein [Botrimarina mediterranea]|uniref:Uncharacterized protein n=1 Tax=Botrimarina mediterranea TaxID=2528022 RepID=A0A518KBB9_9BACT|nr:hypothetical protein [Botrimarina mediterranea]QDV75091.1 hypothetical protein Spa11_33010 [Botrimarina mediterranea]QDV79737.1 hypothetical protein K2D_33530 [Planctomycetes bacterium K2D]
MHWNYLLATAVLFSGIGTASASGLIGFRFTASLAIEAELFGHSIGPDDAVRGHVVFRPHSSTPAPMANCDDCAAYPMRMFNGFVMQVGPLSLRYHDYLAGVSNDGPGLFPDTTEDVIAFSKNVSPSESPTRLVSVNGVPVETAAMDLALVANSLYVDSPHLPLDPQPSDFPIGNILVRDGENLVFGFIDFGSLERFVIPLGDYYLDGEVDALDFTAWRTDYGTIGVSSADGNLDGVVDAADYTIWRDRYGMPPLGVPEPTGAALTVTFLTMACGSMRDERRH